MNIFRYYYLSAITSFYLHILILNYKQKNYQCSIQI